MKASVLFSYIICAKVSVGDTEIYCFCVIVKSYSSVYKKLL